MIIKSFGCSFIFGTDLSDARPDWIGQQHSLLTWPALLAKKLGYQYQCHAHGGAGNLCILNRLLVHLAHNEDAMFIVNWTYIDRFDYRDVNGGPLGMNDWKQIRPGDDSKLAVTYFQHLHSEHRDKITSLMAINAALDILLQQDRKFIMTNMDDLLFDQKYNVDPGIKLLQNKIKPYITTFQGQNFLSWSDSKGFAISDTSHPLEQAHSEASEYMSQIIQIGKNNFE